jgi:methionyl-tRNA synthetase
MLAPFMPGKCDDLWRMLGAPSRLHDVTFDSLESLDPEGWKVTKGDPLFPKEQKP